MDLAVNAGMTLAEASASAPRTFDKQLVAWIAAVQDGQRPIVTAAPRPVHFDDAGLRARLDAIEARSPVADIPADVQELLLLMADRITAAESRAIETERRLATIESALIVLGEEAHKRRVAA